MFPLSDVSPQMIDPQLARILERLEERLGKYDQDLVDLRASIEETHEEIISSESEHEIRDEAYKEGEKKGRAEALAEIEKALIKARKQA